MTDRRACVVMLFAVLACSKKAEGPAEKPASDKPVVEATQPSVGDQRPAGADPFGAEMGAELTAITPRKIRDTPANFGNLVDPHEVPKGVSVYYAPSIEDVHEQIKKAFEKHKVIEHALDVFRAGFEIPGTLEIRLATCDAADIQYDGSKERATICYELIEQAIAAFQPLAKSPELFGTAVAGATFGYLRDVLGHIYGGYDTNEIGQDSATLTIYLGAGDAGAAIILSGAYWLAARRALAPPLRWYDGQHEGNPDAYERAICAVYGASRVKRPSLATQRGVKKAPDACAAVFTDEVASNAKKMQRLLSDRALGVYKLERVKEKEVVYECKSTAGLMVLILSDSKSSNYWKEQQEIFTRNCEDQHWSQDLMNCAFNAHNKEAIVACGLEIKPH